MASVSIRTSEDIFNWEPTRVIKIDRVPMPRQQAICTGVLDGGDWHICGFEHGRTHLYIIPHDGCNFSWSGLFIMYIIMVHSATPSNGQHTMRNNWYHTILGGSFITHSRCLTSSNTQGRVSTKNHVFSRPRRIPNCLVLRIGGDII